jgi:hypothetical protein
MHGKFANLRILRIQKSEIQHQQEGIIIHTAVLLSIRSDDSDREETVMRDKEKASRRSRGIITTLYILLIKIKT